MPESSIDLRSHRPAIERDEVDALRRRLFGGSAPEPEIAGYEIEAKLGEGSFGVVYRAFDPGFQRRVALKVIEYGSPRSLLRIDREAQALARLNHPNVVQVYDKGPAGDSRYYLALEHVEGVGLDVWLGQGSRRVPEILDKFLQIAEGMAAAHAAGLVHRDLKPANAMVGDDGRVRVLDFGLARAPDASLDPSRSLGVDPPTQRSIEEGPASLAPKQALLGTGSGSVGDRMSQLDQRLTADGHFIGTPYYAAPEQHVGRADERSDQFSFCVALYEAIYDSKPYRLRKGSSLLDQLRGQTLRFPRTRRPVPRWLTRMLRRGLQLDPEARHPSMRAIAEELRYRLHERPGHTRTLGLVAGAVALTAAALSSQVHADADPLAACLEERRGGLATWQTHEDAIRERHAGIADELDAIATSWELGNETVCHVAEPERREAIDSCLHRSRTAIEGLIGWLATADEATWMRLAEHPSTRPLVGLVDTLPEPSDCATATEDRVTAPLSAWQRMLDGRILAEQGELDAAWVRSDLAADEAKLVGDRGLRTATRFQAFMIDARRGQPQDLNVALDLASEALAADERPLAAEIIAFTLGRSSVGELELRRNPKVRRIDPNDETLDGLWERDDDTPEVRGWLLAARGLTQSLAGEAAKAQASFREARTTLRTARPPVSPHVLATIELHEATVLAMGPDAEKAPALAEHALELRRKTYGPEHPLVAQALVVLGKLHEWRDDYDAALENLHAADELFERLGLDFDRAEIRGEIANVHHALAMQAYLRGEEVETSGADAGPHWEEFERHRDLALAEVARIDQLLAPFRPEEGDLPARPRAQARLEAIAMRAYSFEPNCWDELMAASRRIERICPHLDGNDLSCTKARVQWQSMLRAGAQRSVSGACLPPQDTEQANSHTSQKGDQKKRKR